MKYGLIIYQDTFNLGDDIQSYADERFLPHVDYIMDRENLDSFCSENGEKVGTIMGGWYLYNHLNWPPSPFIKPMPISMHFDTFYSKTAGEKITRNFVFEDYGATWMLENGPIGCRDTSTLRLMEQYGIPSYFSGCITLTIDPYKDVDNHRKICLVDVPESVKSFVREHTDKECVDMTHSIKMTTLDWDARRKIVERQLRYYQGASLVVTTRLHAALPCLALGVPVLFIKERWSLNRTGTWLEYLNNTPIEELLSGEYQYDFDNPIPNGNQYKKVREKMIDRCHEFIETCEGEKEEYLDRGMFLECNKRINRIKKLMQLRINKYERELNNH